MSAERPPPTVASTNRLPPSGPRALAKPSTSFKPGSATSSLSSSSAVPTGPRFGGTSALSVCLKDSKLTFPTTATKTDGLGARKPIKFKLNSTKSGSTVPVKNVPSAGGLFPLANDVPAEDGLPNGPSSSSSTSLPVTSNPHAVNAVQAQTLGDGSDGGKVGYSPSTYNSITRVNGGAGSVPGIYDTLNTEKFAYPTPDTPNMAHSGSPPAPVHPSLPPRPPSPLSNPPPLPPSRPPPLPPSTPPRSPAARGRRTPPPPSSSPPPLPPSPDLMATTMRSTRPSAPSSSQPHHSASSSRVNEVPTSPARQTEPPEPTSTPYIPDPPKPLPKPTERNFRVLFDPAIDRQPGSSSSGSRGKSKELIYRYDGEVKDDEPPLVVKDPRSNRASTSERERNKTRRPLRSAVYLVERYPWDSNSPGPPPPPPPRAILVTRLSPLTPTAHIRRHFSTFGHIEEFNAQLDRTSGAPLGICWIKYTGPDLEPGSTSMDGIAQKAAKTAVEKCNGTKFGLGGDLAEIKVQLDGEGKICRALVKEDTDRRKREKIKELEREKAEKAKREWEMAERERSAHRERGRERGRDRDRERERERDRDRYDSAHSSHHSTPNHPRTGHSSGTLRPPIPSHLRHHASPSPLHTGSQTPTHDTPSYAPSPSRSRSPSPIASSRPRPGMHQFHALPPRPAVGYDGKPEGAVVSEERVKETHEIMHELASNEFKYISISKSSFPRSARIDERDVRTHFAVAGFPVDKVFQDSKTWYITFQNATAAGRCLILLDGRPLLHHIVTLTVCDAPSASALPAPKKSKVLSDDESIHQAKTLIISLIKSAFSRDLHDRVASTRVWELIDEFVDHNLDVKRGLGLLTGASIAPLVAPEPSSSAVQPQSAGLRGLSFKKKEGTSIAERKRAAELEALREEEERKAKRQKIEEEVLKEASDVEMEVVEEVEDVPVAVVKKGKGAKAGRKKPKKGAVEIDEDVEAIVETIPDLPPEPPAVEDIVVTDVEQEIVKALPVKAKRAPPKPKRQRKTKPPPPPRSPTPDPFDLEIILDDEELFYLQQGLLERRGATITRRSPSPPPVEENTPPPFRIHASGSARTEGYYKIPESAKATYLQRNRAIVDVSTSTTTTAGGTPAATAASASTSRSTRVNTRRLVQGMAAEGDALKFNQLRTRKKQLKFARSPIHDWGLYAMEYIPTGDMVIEYVGEVIRAQVADKREKYYERTGIGSSYLFRVDDDAVVDATKKGNLGRLINHCCAPNCTAKIITINGEKKIVIYAKTNIEPGEEITYDYHFPLEDAKIPCLCGSVKCRGFLN